MKSTAFWMCLIPVSLVTSAAWGQTTTTTRTHNFAPFGLGSTETARVDLSNLAVASAGGTAPSCTGNVAFVNAAGATIGTATNFAVAAGQTSSISLAFGSAGLAGSRGEIRVVLQTTRSTTAPAPCSLFVSLQTFDTSGGATHLYSAGEVSTGGPGRN